MNATIFDIGMNPALWEETTQVYAAIILVVIVVTVFKFIKDYRDHKSN